MPNTTTNRGYITYDRISDTSESFLDFRDDSVGSGATSNINKIDTDMQNAFDQIASVAGTGRTTQNVVQNASDIIALKNQVPQNITAIASSDNIYTATNSSITAYANNLLITATFDTQNTGSATLNVNSLGAITLTKVDVNGNVNNLSAGDLRANRPILFRYNGTVFVAVSSNSADQVNIADSGNIITATDVEGALQEKSNQILESTGYGVISGLTVSAQVTPNMTVNVASGIVHMAGGARLTPIANSALAITTADVTNPRIDIIYVNSVGVISYLAGTPNVIPVVPSVPVGGFLLAEISVSANVITIVTANITDKRIMKNTTDSNANQIGILSNLTTTEKTNLVGAVNEVKTDITALQNEVENSIPAGTLSLSNTSPVVSIDAKVNGGVNFEFEAKPLMVNLLGRDGDFEVDSNADGTADSWVAGAGITASLSATIGVKYGAKSQRYQTSAGNSAYISRLFSYIIGHVYFVRFDYHNVNALINGGGFLGFRTKSSSAGNFAIKSTVQANESGVLGGIRTAVDGDVGLYFIGYDTVNAPDIYIDGVMLIDLTELGETETDVTKLLAKYPYVNGIQPMMGLDIQSCGKNLFDKSKVSILGSILNATTGGLITDANGSISDYIPVKAGSSYIISGKTSYYTGGSSGWCAYDKDFNFISGGNTANVAVSATARYIRLSIAKADYDTFQLEEGTVATAYKSFEGSELLVDGEFGGIGTYLDHVSRKNGVAKVLMKHKKVVLDGTPSWAYYADYAGYKRIRSLLIPPNSSVGGVEITSKFDGKIIEYFSSNPTKADQEFLNTDGYFYISISDTDSGFGETYNTPTVDEIKACMNGWKLNNGVFETPYNGTGTKTWTLWNAVNNTGSVTVCPTTKAAGWTGWATLWYALATPVEEILDTPINGLGVFEGKTTVSLRTGIVKREVKPNQHSGTLRWYINEKGLTSSVVDSPLEYKTNNILRVLRNGEVDSSWVNSISTANQNGTCTAYTENANYDIAAKYEAVYEVLPEEYNSQQVALTAEYTENLRDSHNELVKTVGEEANKLAGHIATTLNKHIKESGSNSNGNYIKFEDGTMICEHSYTVNATVNTAAGGMYMNGTASTWTFPATFSAAPRVIGSLTRASSRATFLFPTTITTTDSGIGFASSMSETAVDYGVKVMAIGRWK